MWVNTTADEENKEGRHAQKTKRCQVTGILEWVQCFTIYIAVVAEKDPGKVKDLLVLLIWDMTATSASQ